MSWNWRDLLLYIRIDRKELKRRLKIMDKIEADYQSINKRKDIKIRIEFTMRDITDNKILSNILNYILSYDEIHGVMYYPLTESVYDELYNSKNEKLRWDLVPWNAFEQIVKVITKGAKKYGIDNWKSVPSNMFDAAMIRHYVSFKKGIHIDPQWNLPHMAHLACNAIFLLWKELLIINIEKRGELKSIGASKDLKKW